MTTSVEWAIVTGLLVVVWQVPGRQATPFLDAVLLGFAVTAALISISVACRRR